MVAQPPLRAGLHRTPTRTCVSPLPSTPDHEDQAGKLPVAKACPHNPLYIYTIYIYIYLRSPYIPHQPRACGLSQVQRKLAITPLTTFTPYNKSFPAHPSCQGCDPSGCSRYTKGSSGRNPNASITDGSWMTSGKCWCNIKDGEAELLPIPYLLIRDPISTVLLINWKRHSSALLLAFRHGE